MTVHIRKTILMYKCTLIYWYGLRYVFIIVHIWNTLVMIRYKHGLRYIFIQCMYGTQYLCTGVFLYIGMGFHNSSYIENDIHV